MTRLRLIGQELSVPTGDIPSIVKATLGGCPFEPAFGLSAALNADLRFLNPF